MNTVRMLSRRVAALLRDLLWDVCARGRRTPDEECADACGSRPLTRIPTGTTGTVSCLSDPGARESRKLASMGLLPGVPVELLQRRPVYVIRTRSTEYALDEELASRVRVVLGEPGAAEAGDRREDRDRWAVGAGER